jgi:hypothetical protein
MKVFISWSGDRSKAIAEALRDWLPLVIQRLKPFMSRGDIPAGGRWRQVLAKELQTTDFGISCLTPENLPAEWILYEAGALAKFEDSRVCTYLYDLRPTDVEGPLAEFNHRQVSPEGTLDVLRSINQCLPDDAVLPEARLEKIFQQWWPDLDKRLKAVDEMEAVEAPERTDTEMIQEILELVRGQVRLSTGFGYNTLAPGQIIPSQMTYFAPADRSSPVLGGSGGAVVSYGLGTPGVVYPSNLSRILTPAESDAYMRTRLQLAKQVNEQAEEAAKARKHEPEGGASPTTSPDATPPK